MSKLDRLFAQAQAGEEARRPASSAPPRPPPVAEEAALPPDLSEPARILAAFARADFAACLRLQPVELNELGRPAWPVSDACAARREPRPSTELTREQAAQPRLPHSLAVGAP